MFVEPTMDDVTQLNYHLFIHIFAPVLLNDRHKRVKRVDGSTRRFTVLPKNSEQKWLRFRFVADERKYLI
jgi:hypothetical protein